MPPTPDLSSQKMTPPRGAEFLPTKVAEDKMSTAHRPTIQEMVKAAMAGTLDKVDFNAEATRQLSLHNGREVEEEKTASDVSHYSTEHVTKLAAALGYIADQIKEADAGSNVGVGKGPGALHVMHAKAQGTVLEAGQSGHAVSKDLPAASTTQGEKVQVGKANTGLTTNDDTRHPAQPLEPIPNQKVTLKHAAALQASNLDRVYKLAGLKIAEDAINPAKITAGPVAPHSGLKSGEGGPSEPSDVNSQKRMIASNEAAINYTKQEAKADPKADVNHLLVEPALSAAHDNVLNKAFTHTGVAGVKLSSEVKAAATRMAEGSIKVAAARALLSKLVKSAAVKCETCGKEPCACDKKEKKSAMGSAPTTPSSASGFTASSLQ